jgi:hypothetical protein
VVILAGEELGAECRRLRLVERMEAERESLIAGRSHWVSEDDERFLETLNVDLERVSRGVDRWRLERQLGDLVGDRDPG